MEISATLVKQLREKTGAGMMDCKKALVENQGDFHAAVKWLEEHTLAAASKKSDRVAAEGIIVKAISADGKQAVLVEINSQTDFVARNEEFQNFAHGVAKQALAHQITSIDALLNTAFEDHQDLTIHQKSQQMIAKIGENIVIRRVHYMASEVQLGVYVHNNHRIGAIVDIKNGNEKIAKEMAMHIAASHPLAIKEQDLPSQVIDEKKQQITEQLRQSGKAASMIEQTLNDELEIFLNESCLLRQPFILAPDQTIAQYLQTAKATVKDFCRFELGEGIEKVTSDFAAEVMAQVRGV